MLHHCPAPFKMWLFSDGQGNFDPLRLLWSKIPSNRSSTSEFKLILSLPTTSPLLRFRVKAKALPSCQSCWQPAELKAVSNADDQCEWLTANGLHSCFFCVCGGKGLSHTWVLEQFFIFIFFQENYEVCKLSCLLSYSSGFCWDRMTTCFMRLSFKVSLTVILAPFRGSELVGFATAPRSSCEVTAAKHCHSSVTKEQKCD